MFEHYSALQGYIADLPDREPEIVQTATAKKADAKAKILSAKCTLLWAHHLLASSKRKDIQHWSTELQVWSIARVGSVAQKRTWFFRRLAGPPYQFAGTLA